MHYNPYKNNNIKLTKVKKTKQNNNKIKNEAEESNKLYSKT